MISFQIAIIVFSSGNILFHAIGFHLVRHLNKVKQTTHMMYIFHLSICEILINILTLLATTLKMTRKQDGKGIANGTSVDRIYTYVDLVYLSGPWLVYFILMSSITFDKLLEIVLHLKYPHYWNEFKAKVLMRASWIFTSTYAFSDF